MVSALLRRLASLAVGSVAVALAANPCGLAETAGLVAVVAGKAGLALSGCIVKLVSCLRKLGRRVTSASSKPSTAC